MTASIESPEIVFVVGMPRSGSTAFFEVIARHPEMCGPTNGSRKTPTSAALIKWFSRFKELEPREMGTVWDKMLVADHDVLRAEDVTPQNRAFATRIIQAHCKAYQRSVFLAKCPRLGLRIPFFHEIFPHAKFLHLIRDGRAVSRSVLEKRRVGGGADTDWWDVKPANWKDLVSDNPMISLGGQWRETVKATAEEGRKLPDGLYKEIRYEDFTEDPVGIIQDVLGWVDLSWDTEDLTERTSHIQSKNYKWVESFSAEEVADLTNEMRPMLEEFNYPLEVPASS